MKTYINILQLHANVKNISYPNNLISKNVELPTILWNNSIDNTTTCNFWPCLFRQEDTGELGYEDNSVHFQLFFVISSMAYFYIEPIEKQISRKYFLINKTVNNIFLSKTIKDKLQNIFEKTQRTYLALARFANIVRYKISKEKIDFDLRMDPIDIRNKFSILLYHSGAKYLFTLTDLINIIQTAITYSEEIFEKPLFPKNPYNNLPFTKTQLYNIYFKVKFTFTVIPIWFHLFYISEFNIDAFKLENEQKLREYYIKNYINNSADSNLIIEVNSMLAMYKRVIRCIHIHKNFPLKKLVEIFRPYIYLFVMSIDSVDGTEKKRLSKLILRRKLEDFSVFNENFGRKIITTRYINISIENSFTPLDNSLNSIIGPRSITSRKIVIDVSFNMKHPVFTLKDAYESFNIKKSYKPTFRSILQEVHDNEIDDES